MTLFRGLVAFPITPMDAQGHVDTAALGRLVARLVAAGVDSIGVLGSTGSYPYLTRAERRRAIEAAVAEAGGRVPVMAGVGALRTDEAVECAQDAKAAGASAGLLAPVSYTPLTEDEVFAHFAAVAGATDLPICIYNNPGTTHFTFTDALIARLSRLPNVAAVKNPAPEPAAAPAALSALRGLVPSGFSLGYSTDWNAAGAMIAGADAWYSVLAGLFPGVCLEIAHAIAERDHVRARALDEHLAPLWQLFKSFSSLRVIYAAANLLGLCDAAPPLPIQPLGESARRQVAEVLERLGLTA